METLMTSDRSLIFHTCYLPLRRCRFFINMLVVIVVGCISGFGFTYSLLYVWHFSTTTCLSGPHLLSDVSGESERKGFVGNQRHTGLIQFDKQHQEYDTAAVALANRVRILCLILTQPKNHESRARQVLKTWGSRCNGVIFVTSKKDLSLPAVVANVQEEKVFLWGKTKTAFHYAYKHLNIYDWFMKADDDTFVIVENLRYLLSAYNSNEPVYFGCRFKTFLSQGYMSGGSGYVLSREAVRRLVENGFSNKSNCYQGADGDEDLEIGKCLENVGVIAKDSRDALGRPRFLPLYPRKHVSHGEFPDWYWEYAYYLPQEGKECCSDSLVSFHYVGPRDMHIMEYLIYHLRPYGITTHVVPASLPEQ